MSGRYTVKPKADQDLDDYADYLAREASLEVALRFYAEAHNTFTLMAAHPNIGWPARLNLPQLESLRVFRVSGFERMLILYRPLPAGVDILRVVHGSRDLQGLLRRRAEIE